MSQNIAELKEGLEAKKECWFSVVYLDDTTVEIVADEMNCRDAAIRATRSWFAINEMEAEPFQVFRRFEGRDE